MRAEPTMATFLSSAISGFPFFARLHGAAQERRKSGPQDHPDIGEIGIGDDAFADHRLRGVDHRLHQLATERSEVAMLRDLTLLHLAVDPFLKALAALAAELLLRHQRGKPRARRHLVAKLFGNARADIEPHGI